MNDTITRLNRALTERYLVEKEIGAGGMATVFLADDLKHNRKVAIKVLRPDLAAVVGAERFFSEIETTAQLQHPNILPLFDSGEADGLLFYAMPYVEGETLAQRLKREQQLPVDHALDIGRKISAALDYAHQRGIVHRDVKPANILLSSGEPLVADFGIALAVTHAGDGRITETGLSLGTPHYMSPEQASGDRSLDPRSDVYAVGCVLYEMLVGEPPFPGPTPQSVLARILTSAPNRVSALRPTVPPHVDAAIARALEKLPADRFESASDLRKALDDPSFTHTTATTTSAAVMPAIPVRTKRPMKTGALLGALGVTVVVAALGWFRAGPTQPVYLFEIDLPVGAQFGPDIAISPDGSRLAYVGLDGFIYIRSLSSLQDQLIPGTEAARIPFFSPNGQGLGVNLGFGFRDDAMYTVTLNGSSPVALGEQLEDSNPGGAWGEDGYVYFTGDVGGEGNDVFLRVPAQGGSYEVVATDHPVYWPASLPGGGTLLVGARFDDEGTDFGLGVLDVRTGEIRRIAGVSSSSFSRYAGGHLFWVGFDAILMAAPFDPRRAELTGPSVVLAQGVMLNGGTAEMAVSDNGTLIYQQGIDDAAGVGETLGWIDRSGSPTVINARLAGDVGDFDFASLSPEGRYVAVATQIGPDGPGAEYQIQIYDLEQETLGPLTFEGRRNENPRWMADGRVAYVSDQGGGFGIYAQPFDRSGSDELIFRSDHEIASFDTGPRTDSPLAAELRPDSASGVAQGVYAVSTSGNGDPRPVVATRFLEGAPRISPDGRWVVYISDESGRPEIYVRAFPDGGRPYPISTEGGTAPAWGANGDEIFFRNLNNQMVLAELDLENGIMVRQRQALFDVSTFEIGGAASYDVAPDGRLLAVLEQSAQQGSGAATTVVVVVNVFEEIQRRMRAAGG